MTITTTHAAPSTETTTGTAAAFGSALDGSAPSVVVDRPRLTARSTLWLAGGLAAVAVVAAAGSLAHRSTVETPGSTVTVGSQAVGTQGALGDSVTRSDAAESAHGAGAHVVLGSGIRPTAALTAASVAATDAAESVHGSAGDIRTGSGLRLGGSTASTANSSLVPSSDILDRVHGTAGSISDASGPVLTLAR